MKFVSHIEKCGKEEVLHLCNMQKHDSRSIFGKNYKDIFIFKKDVTVPYVTAVEDAWKINFVKELISLRCNQMFVPEFEDRDLEDMLQELCCN